MRVRPNQGDERIDRRFVVEDGRFVGVDGCATAAAAGPFSVCWHGYRPPGARPGLPIGSRSRFKFLRAVIIAARLSRSTAQAGLALSWPNLSTVTAPCWSTRAEAIDIRSMARIAVSRMSSPA